MNRKTLDWGKVDWDGLERDLIARRRDLHKYPESAWTEFRTSSLVAHRLEELGYDLTAGLDTVEFSAVMGRPPRSEIDAHIQRAKEQGGDAGWIDKMREYPGVVGTLRTGRPGPVVSIRFDMDCVDVDETKIPDHRPNKEGFASVNNLLMHACGHDAHTSMGLGLATVLAAVKDDLKGEVRLIFQPGEEGCRGAYAMTRKGVVDGSDYFLAMHIGGGVPSGKFGLNSLGYLCTTKFDVEFTGRPAHAAGAPQEGHNALLAAAAAALSLHGIAPHREGSMRVNVGVLNAGTGRNVIAGKALMKAETRGQTQNIADYVYKRAQEIIQGAAAMYETEVTVLKAGAGTDAAGDAPLVAKVGEAIRESGLFQEVLETVQGGGSEDATWMMRRVQELGGQATYLALGSNIAAPHHNGCFDIDESTMLLGVKALAAIIDKLMQ
ncbi:MAG: amidohydrolase [Synergistaceae bacterium]|jgi:aminobenzoyl-glutamate utilization protein A|nr:amidohydrolase [Synergistaceae bacterium]